MKYKILYLPVETMNRELLGKLLTAACAARRGWFVFLGHARAVRGLMKGFLPGVYSEISIPEYKYQSHLLSFSRSGHTIVNMCEESVTYPEGRDYCDRKVGVKALSLVELFFASGRRHFQHVSKYRDIDPRRMPITGVHRMDVLRPGYREVFSAMARDIRDSVGPFILVNTNFARCNPHPGYGNRLEGLQKKNVVSSRDQVRIWQGSKDYKARLMAGFMDFIPDLASGLGCTVVVRPHPSENHDVWSDWARTRRNVLIRHEGSANEWMMAARAVIHNGCTTGLEGFMLERPVIAYVPDPENDFSINIANQVSHEVATRKELMEALDRALSRGTLDTGEERAARTGRLRYFVENADGPPACEAIVRELEAIDAPCHPLDAILQRTGAGGSTRGMGGGLKNLFRKGMSLVRGNEKPACEKVLQKFPGISREEMLEPLKTWQDAGLITLPRLGEVEKNLFFVYQDR